ncbi:MAG: iron ABC transporter permease [Deltaproteobacteria bacterium]|nr:iron ABC transporter permease [Deltaproteobacteria bacterium]
MQLPVVHQRYRMTTKRSVFWLTVLVTILVSGLPLFNLIQLALSRIELSLFDTSLVRIIWNTFLIAALTTFFSLLLGTFCGFVLCRTNLFLKKGIKSFLLYPYIIPSIIIAIGWAILANPSVGLLKEILPGINIYSIGGIVFVEALYWYTFVMLNISNVLENIDGSLEESARMCGAGIFRVFFTITLPLLRPALIGSSILVFLCSISSFAVPAIIGGPGRITVLTTKIYQWIKIGSPNALSQAMMLSVPIVVLAFGLGYISEKWLNRKSYATLGGKQTRKLEINLRHWRLPMTSVFILFSVLAIGMPLLTVLVTSLMKVYGHWDLSLDNYRWVLMRKDMQQAILNSLLLAFGGGILIVFLSFFIAYYREKTRYRFRNLMVTFASLPYAAPGTILAFAILFSFLGSPAYFLLLFAYVAKYLNYGLRVISPAMSNVDKSLEEASLMCGASWFRTLGSIWVPILKGTFSTALFLLIAPLFSELTMSVILSAADFPTVGLRLFHLQEYESPFLASVLAVVILFLVLGLNFLVKRLSRGRLGV